MLLKVLMDFRSLKIRDEAQAATHIHKQKEKIIIIIKTKKQNNNTKTGQNIWSGAFGKN